MKAFLVIVLLLLKPEISLFTAIILVIVLAIIIGTLAGKMPGNGGGDNDPTDWGSDDFDFD